MQFSWIKAKDLQLAIVTRPRGGDWLRDDLHRLRRDGIEVVVSLLPLEESLELGLGQESHYCTDLGMRFLTFPIADRSVPHSMADFSKFIQEIVLELDVGHSLGIHCRAGIGRSAILAACLLVWYGYQANTAFESIAIARGCSVPDTVEQRAWVECWAKTLGVQ